MRGKFPYSLTMGFETEFSLPARVCNSILGNGDNKIPLNSLHASTPECFYFKHDCTCGYEMNSFPFNYNWFINNENKVKDSISALVTKNGAWANRKCGFHIHVGKEYLNGNHLRRFRDFLYSNANFFKNISLRPNGQSLSLYASFNKNLKSDKYAAVNTRHRKTVEVRIFQGTLNWNIIKSYIEVIMSAVIYTRNDQAPSLVKYKKFLVENGETFHNARWFIKNNKRLLKGQLWKTKKIPKIPKLHKIPS